MSTRACKHPDGCDRPAVKSRGGWCRMHGARIARGDGPGEAEPRKEARNKDNSYGDNSYRGTGRLICQDCGAPYRDHDNLRTHPGNLSHPRGMMTT